MGRVRRQILLKGLGLWTCLGLTGHRPLYDLGLQYCEKKRFIKGHLLICVNKIMS